MTLPFPLLIALLGIVPSSLCLDVQLLHLDAEGPPQISNSQRPAPILIGLEDALQTLGRLSFAAEVSANARKQQRIRRTLKSGTRRHVLVLDAKANNGTDGGRCIISADQAVHFCGFAEEVNEPPILPHLNGVCRKSEQSDRTICYPRYEELDTTCTDAASSNERSGLVAPPVIPHAIVRTMAFVPPDNLHRLIRQYYRLHGKPYPKNETEKFSSRSFLFVKYGCEPGYELQDEADTMFCRNRQWVQTPPVCRGKGLCERDNGGCSHSCISFAQNQTVECRCPKGMVLDNDGRTCVKPVPKSLCRKLAGCTCSPVDTKQLSCSCPGGEKCLLVHGKPKIYLAPQPDYQVEPGGSLNITCSAVAFPFPEIVWEREQEGINWPSQTTPGGSVRSEQVLIIKEIYKSTNFTCHARNALGDASRLVRVEVTGPGSAPVLRELNAGRSSIEVHWERPHVINRPLTIYSLHYSTDPSLPIREWSQVNVPAPAEAHTIPGLSPDTLYTIRIRAHDLLGPGKLSNPVSVRTLPPAKRPFVVIPEGPEIRVPPKVPFGINCNLSRGDPIPEMHWESRGRNISAAQQSRHIALQHSGLYESSEFLCVAENEAGRTVQKVFVLVTGPSQPERVRYHVDGNTITLQWEEPRITNGPMADYEVFFTDQPDLPDDQWSVRRSGGPEAKSITLGGLKEETEYTVKVRGINRNGPGLFSLPFSERTWLAPRPPTVTTNPGGVVELQPSQEELEVDCEAEGVPRPRLLWWWEGHPVEDGRGGFRIVEGTPLDEPVRSQQKLRFQSSTRSGTLKCQAINERGVAEATLQVAILGPGTPPDQISVRPVQDGFSVHWQAPSVPNGDVTNYILYWSRDPDAELSDWSQQTFGADAREATITGQEEQTPYVIRLQAIGRAGPGIISPSYEVVTGLKHIPLAITLRILEPEIAAGEKKTGTLVDPGQSVRFQCVADGRPQPTVTWSWVGNASAGSIHLAMVPDPAQPHRFVSAPTEASTATSRTLLCEGRNEQGQVQDSHPFRVLRPGGPPKELGSLVDVDNEVTLNWNPPVHPNEQLTGYTIYVSPDPSLPLEQWRVFSSPANTTYLVFPRGELEPLTPYYVRVAAENPHGQGQLSDISRFVTLSGAPLDPPTDVLVQVGPDNTITASWSPPSQPNGELKHYTVYFVPAEQAEDDQYKHWPHVQVPIRPDGSGQVQLDREVHNILPERDYRFRVTATNELSEGPASAVAPFRTGTGQVAPSLALLPADNPASVAPLGDYSVGCEGTGLPAPEVWWTLGTEGQRQAGGAQLRLHKMVKDVVAVCHGQNAAGKVEMVLTVQVAGPGTPPNEIVAMPLPGQVLAVEWTAPDEPNGKLTGYAIHYAEVPEGQLEPSGEDWRQVGVGPDENKHQLVALKPKTLYWVRLQAISERGPGVLSDPVKARTLPLAPKAPDVMPVQVHPNNTVIVQFVPSDDPEQEGRKVPSYKILYTKQDPGLEDTVWNEIVWSVPPGVDPTKQVQVFIDGMRFDPQTKYHVKVIPIGEIEGPPSVPKDFDTQTGIVAPDQPLVHVDTEDNVLKVPAGTDYTVECTANGFPPPKLIWTDADGNVVSEDGMLRVLDIRQHRDFLCVAENAGGRTETKFRIFVIGPGSAPENVRLSTTRPKSILVKFDPPTIPNGNITRYIIYYTPLDDQSRDLLVGQVPQKPVSEWMTTHMVGEGVGQPGQKQAMLTDFVEPDTAYAVVVQAANNDGPGPYSIQHNIRTMSRARAAPPTQLFVEPINQTSVEVRWRHAIESGEENPLSYEIYFVPAEKRIEEDEQRSLPKWTRVEVPDPTKNSHMIWNQLEPDTEYVFKIRALYPSGPGVFSEPCIAKTLPEGDAPFLVVSAGGRGTEGESLVQLLPMSDYTVFCRASGKPQPAVRWIRGGDIPIDPSTVKEDETGTKWSLSLANISEPSTFNCVARNPLGAANWTIRLELVEGLRQDWLAQLARPEQRQGQLWLHFADSLPDSLRRPNQWTLRYSDDPNKERILWSVLESEDRALTSIPIKSPADPMLPGLTYYLVIENPNEGVRSPVLTVLIPKAPSELRVGSNINDEMVVDFRPAIASTPVRQYLVKYWPAGKEGEELAPDSVLTIAVPGNRSIGIRVPDLPRDAEFFFQAVAELADGQQLASPPVLIRTPAKEIRCDCSHACRLLETDSVEVRIECYCPEGWELADDGRTCAQPEPTTGPVIEVSPTFELDQQSPEQARGGELLVASSEQPHELSATSPLPTDEYGHVVTADLEQFTPHVLPTDSLGREIRPVVFFNGSQLRTDSELNYYDQLGRKVQRDEEQRALGPDGKVLRMDARGNFVYPPLDKYGEPMPTDANLRPVYEVVDEEGGHWPRDEHGRSLGHQGRPVPTDAYGLPLGPGSSPLPTNFYGQFVLGRQQVEVLPTDSLGYPIHPVVFPDGQLLPTSSTGLFLDPEKGEELARDEQGRPLGSGGKPLAQNARGQFVFRPALTEKGPDQGLEQRQGQSPEVRPEQALDESTTPRPPVLVVGPDGLPMPTDRRGLALDAQGQPLPTNPEGLLIGPDGSPLPTDSQGRFMVQPGPSIEEEEVEEEEAAAKTLPTDSESREVQVVDQHGELLPMNAAGHFLDERGRPIPTDSAGHPLDARGRVLATNARGQFVYSRPDTTLLPLPARPAGGEVAVVDAEGRSLERDEHGNVLDGRGQPLPTSAEGLLLSPDGSPLPTNVEGQFVFAFAEERDQGRVPPTDAAGHVIHAVVGPDGGMLERDPGTGQYLDEMGEPIRTDDFGRPLDHKGEVLPTNLYGEFVWIGTTKTPTTHEIGPDGLPVPSSKKVPAPAFPESRDRPALEEQAQCRIGEAVVDLLIAVNDELLQSSGDHLRSALEDLLGRFDLSADATRVGILKFGKSVTIPVSLGGYHDRDELLDGMRGMSHSNAALGVPDIGAAYRAAVQQFDDFGRDNEVPRVLLLFSSGEDIFPDSSARQSLTPMGAFLLLVGPSSYDAEIAEESSEHIFVDKWSHLSGERLADYLEAACQRAILRLPKSKAKFVTGKPSADMEGTTSVPAISANIRPPPGPPTSSEQCAALQQRSRLLLAVETSDASTDVRERLGHALLHFTREYVERKGAQVGILYYGDTVEVGLDVGHYKDHRELEESVQEMHFVGGSPDPVLAMRTAQQLLAEAGQNTIKVVLHVHRHRLPASVEAEVERLAHQENIALLDLFYERWASLENLEPYWSSQLCMLQALIERLEDTVPANVDEIFFGPGYQQGRITPPAVATPQPTIVSIVTEAPSVDARILPTERSGKAAHPVLGPDGQLMPVDANGNYLDLQGQPLPLDEFGRPLDSEGRLLPQDSRGFFLLHTTGPDQSPPTRQPVASIGGSPLPTDESGEVVTEHEVGRGEMALPTDQTGRFIHPVLNAITGEPLPTDHLGRYLDTNGELLPTDDFGRPLDPQTGELLRTNRFGHFIYTPPAQPSPLVTEIGPDGLPLPTEVGRTPGEAKAFPRDEFGPEPIPVVDHTGKPLPTDPSGQFLDGQGEPLPVDHLGRPLDAEGRPLPTDRHGQFVFTPAVSVPTTTPISRHFASPLPTDFQGHPVSVGAAPDEAEEDRIRTLPTDGTGKQIFPVINADTGLPLARNSEGRYVTARGELVPVDDFGRPLNAQGRVLPANEFGQFLLAEPDQSLATISYEEGPGVKPDERQREQQIEQRRRNNTRHCFVSGFIELLLIFDTSANVKILDYRMMKEAVKGFLLDHFDLRPNRGVRLGLLKYGDSVEVPIALGDYDSEAELLARMGETRRLKGEPNLALALQEAAGEFQLSGADEAPRVVLIWKSGNSSGGGNIRAAADALRQQFGALLLVVSAAGQPGPEDFALVGGNAGRVFAFDGWREADPERLGQVADEICKLIPSAKKAPDGIGWPSRPKSTPAEPAIIPRDCKRVDYPLDLIMAVDATNFETGPFTRILESLSTLADESFDLSPDVVRIGLLVYSDTVAVPVALGHYEDKIELLSKMAASPRLPSSAAIVLRGLEAAQQQFQLHGRKGAARVVLLVTNGKHRGNAAAVAQEMRENFGVQIYAVAIGAEADQLASLTRVVGGPELAKERLVRLEAVEELADAEQLAFLRRALCSSSSRTTRAWPRRHTVKRDLGTNSAVLSPILGFATSSAPTRRVTRDLRRPMPLCPDGFLRPFLFSILLDLSQPATVNRSTVDAALAHFTAFMHERFSVESQRVRLNLFGVDSTGLRKSIENVPVEQLGQALKEMRQMEVQNPLAPPKLGMAISTAAALSREEAIPGVNQILLLLSMDGRTSDKAEFDVSRGQHLVAISMITPRSDLLRSLASGISTRVIHFADWTEAKTGKHFGRWLAFAICDCVVRQKVVNSTNSLRTSSIAPIHTSSTRMPKWRRLLSEAPLLSAEKEPKEVLLRPLSASSLLLSWTCCSNQNPRTNYSVLFSPNPTLPFPSKWARRSATCRDSFGFRLERLPTNAEYTACVLSNQKMAEIERDGDFLLANRPELSDQCDRAWLSQTEAEHAANALAREGPTLGCPNCACDANGQPTPPPTQCPAQSGKCQCRQASDGQGNCPIGFRLEGSQCFDVNECGHANGGCSHGCVNTPGTFYCACPPPLVLDPADGRQCVPVKNGLARAVDLLGHLARLSQQNGGSNAQNG